MLGVAVLASVFSGAGGYATPQAFVAGLIPAVTVAAIVLALGATAALAVPACVAGPPPRRRSPQPRVMPSAARAWPVREAGRAATARAGPAAQTTSRSAPVWTS